MAKAKENGNEEIYEIVELCGAWCFLLGTVGSNLPTCSLVKDHPGSHQTKIEVHIEPESEFLIEWKLTGANI